MMVGETSTRANANPSKAFFISMLTRDIDLSDCVLDLLDNAVDGITESAKRDGIELPADAPFAGKEVRLTPKPLLLFGLPHSERPARKHLREPIAPFPMPVFGLVDMSDKKRLRRL